MQIPWFQYDCASFYHPSLEYACDARFESGRQRLLDLILITQIITFCHCSFTEVREQWCEPLDMVVWLLQQLGDSDWVMKTLRESQQHSDLGPLCWCQSKLLRIQVEYEDEDGERRRRD